jgi:hypothetical protein
MSTFPPSKTPQGPAASDPPLSSPPAVLIDTPTESAGGCAASAFAGDDAFERATAKQRSRALVREAAVLAYEEFLCESNPQGRLTAKRGWVAQYKLQHPEIGVISVRSIERWRGLFRSGSGGRASLIDANNGSARRGKTVIPRPALNFFLARYLDKDAPPTIARAIEDTRLAASQHGWQLPEADDAFYRYAKRHVPQSVKLARREAVDTPSKFLPYIARAMDTPYRTLQSDHHIVDVFVSCEGSACGNAPCRAHRPWFTPMYDVGSRKVISYQISLDPPNAERILRAFYLAVLKEGLPERFYCDNGKDFKKAAEKKGRLTPDDEDFLGRRMKSLGIEIVFATPYNAQAKGIERWFGTMVSRWWCGSKGYVGRLGQRSEHTQHLCKNPELLTPFSEFTRLVEGWITLYNNRPHRGVGMGGRTPARAFSEERIPRRDPDAFAFKLVFWRMVERSVSRVHRGYGVRESNLVYTFIDPDAHVAAEYLGERVKVLINPEDRSQAIVCNLAEQFLCEARELDLATHDTNDAATEQALEHVKRIGRAMRSRVHAGDALACADLREFQQHYPELVAREAARLREEEDRLVAAGGSPATVMVPRYSRIARDLQASQQRLDNPLSLTAEERELAQSIDLPTNAEIAAMAGATRLHAVAPLPAEEHSGIDELLQEMDLEARRREREQAGFCAAALDCPNAGPICPNHEKELSGH